MSKRDFVEAVAENAGLTKKDADAAVKAVTQVIIEQVAAGDKISLVGFGTFESGTRAARQGRNPQTGEPMDIPETKVPKFKPGKAFKDAVKA